MRDPLLGATVGNYRIVDVLGEGGMGKVYRATHPELDRTVAVKVLALGFASSEEIVRRFRVEARAVNKISPEGMGRLVRHSWPGNVRELRNVMERACRLARGTSINLEDALVSEAAPSLGIRTDLPFKEAKGQLVEMFEREYIEDLMRRHKMNLSAAARRSPDRSQALRELIRKYGLDPRVKLEGDDDSAED